MYCLAVHDTLMGILPTPTIFGLIVLRCANTDAAGLVIKETPFERQRIYEFARFAAQCGGSCFQVVFYCITELRAHVTIVEVSIYLEKG